MLRMIVMGGWFPAVLGLLLVSATARGGTLAVGPGKRFAVPSAAIAASKTGDVVEIDAAGRYDGDVAIIHTKGLTIRGVGRGRAKLDSKGKSADKKGIFLQSADNLTVENIEFVGARCPDHNGAGIRGQGRGLVVRNCRFYDCENGILGGMGDVLVEQSEFDHCGHSTDPKSPTHGCYFSEQVTSLTFRFNYATHSLAGHLLKSRARESWVLYNRLSSEGGKGSALADFPNGGLVVVLGNVLQKGASDVNSHIIMWGTEGLRYERNALFVVHNTLLYEQPRPGSLAHVDNPPRGFRPVLRNNLCIGKDLTLTNAPAADGGGNLLFNQAAKAGLTDLPKWDLRPRSNSPCVNAGIDPGRAGSASLAPAFEYVHPASHDKRRTDGKPDVGAYEAARQDAVVPVTPSSRTPGIARAWRGGRSRRWGIRDHERRLGLWMCDEAKPLGTRGRRLSVTREASRVNGILPRW